MLAILRQMALQRRAKTSPGGEEAAEKLLGGFPSRVALHWSCRGVVEFALLEADLIDLHV